jgi:2-haloacid dehalogenase
MPSPSELVQGSVSTRAVVFDLGGVLIDWNPRHLYRSLFDGDDEAMELFLTTVTTPEWNLEQDRGRPFAVAVEELVERHPHQEALIRAYWGRWREMIKGPIDDTVALLADLRARGVPLYALTNWSAETFAMARHEFEFLGWFKGIMVSGEERMAKPDAAIFRLLIERYHLEPDQTVYIDDSRANVEQARRLGLDAIHFSTAGRLREDLRARDLVD